ncbi:FMN-dependent NADH-azoreductase [Sneathiella glossodoripedis]|uniref:FMN-dependent NADH-azoreductase n=1 Tax=Sneathiella glossodoripedis TaxID=418853 RepID=UPI00046FE763|nr:NAD(P)H-dependent oxidoreductase [Sneathiella glossodoripedis]
MTQILQITSSILGDGSQSTAISKRVVDQLLSNHSDAKLVTRDLERNPVPHLDSERLASFNLGAEELNDVQREALNLSNSLIADVQDADIIVLGIPMYNFAIPSQLKSWFDYIARAGITFRYTESGPEGLLKGKKVYAIVTSGGFYKGTAQDGITPYLDTILGFLGLDDVEYIHAEGLNIDDASRDRAAKQIEDRLQILAAA